MHREASDRDCSSTAGPWGDIRGDRGEDIYSRPAADTSSWEMGHHDPAFLRDKPPFVRQVIQQTGGGHIVTKSSKWNQKPSGYGLEQHGRCTVPRYLKQMGCSGIAPPPLYAANDEPRLTYLLFSSRRPGSLRARYELTADIRGF